MRRLAIIVCALVIALMASSGASLAAGVLSGSFTSQIGLGVSVGESFVQTESAKTFGTLSVSYKIDTFTFSSTTAYDFYGISQQVFGLNGTVGLVRVNSQLSFSPLFGGPGSTINLTNSVNDPTQQFDLGKVYFVDQIEVTALTLDDNANTTWRVRTSADGSDWTWVSNEIIGNGSVPVVILVSSLARYIEIVASSGGFVDESAISVQVSAQSFVTTLRLDLAGISLNTKFAFATGGSSFTITAQPTEKGSLLERAKIVFGMDPITCASGFKSFDVAMGMSFGCVEEISVDIGFDCEGFTELEISARDIKTGFSWFEVDLSITYSLTEKQVMLSPSLELDTAGMCITPLLKLDTGTGTMQLAGLTFYGLRMSASINGVTLTSLSYLDDIHHTKEDYWEMFSIAVNGDTCCGRGFNLKATTHFSKTSNSLFDWAETEFDVELGIVEGFVFDMYLAYTSSGIDELTLGFAVTW